MTNTAHPLPEDISPATAGSDWLNLKAAALSLQLGIRHDRTLLIRSFYLNAFALMINLIAIAFWRPQLLLVPIYIFGMMWLLFLTIVAADAVWRWIR